jgi:uncharacterized repeat protein (TIGR03803 family)
MTPGRRQDRIHPTAPFGFLKEVVRYPEHQSMPIIFEVTTAGKETVLYNFCSQPGCVDGSYTSAGLLRDSAGNLYGTTFYGGASGDGTVFKLTP